MRPARGRREVTRVETSADKSESIPPPLRRERGAASRACMRLRRCPGYGTLHIDEAGALSSGSGRSSPRLPEEVRRAFGKAIYDLQSGHTLAMPLSRPMPTLGPARPSYASATQRGSTVLSTW
jgi:hypothetical protein